MQTLEKHQIQLLKDSATMDKMYALNLNYFKELSMYILAGKKKLQEVREGELKELTLKAQMSNLPEDDCRHSFTQVLADVHLLLFQKSCFCLSDIAFNLLKGISVQTKDAGTDIINITSLMLKTLLSEGCTVFWLANISLRVWIHGATLSQY